MSNSSSQPVGEPPASPHTAAIEQLQAIYGKPSQSGFGSAVFCDRADPTLLLETVALHYYQYFLGDLWERFGAATWLTSWRQVYLRDPAHPRQIVSELQTLPGSAAQGAADLILTSISTPAAGQQALSAVYDDPAMTDLTIYTLGDGAAMSGLLIAGRYDHEATVLLVFLLD